MGKIIATAAMSVDGYVAYPDDTVGPLFDWYNNGPVEFFGADPDRAFHLTRASADYLGQVWSNIGAGIIGRRLFDLTNGWDGQPPVGDAIFVVTHTAPTDWPYPDAPYQFVTDGLAAAVDQARAFAGDRDVTLTGGNLTGQALAAGLVDELAVALIPVVLGAGVAFFGDFTGPTIRLDNPEVVVGDRVTHLHYAVSSA